MPDFRNSVFSFQIDLFRLLAPPLRDWHIEESSLPCWRLWWNSNPGASIVHEGKRVLLLPERFVLVAPETRFDASLVKPIKRHLFIHFHIASEAWRLKNKVFIIPTRAETKGLLKVLLKALPVNPDIAWVEPLKGLSLVCSVLAGIEQAQWSKPVNDERVRRVISAIDAQPGIDWSDAKFARLSTMSVGGFVRLFRQNMEGVSPQAYLKAQRFARARILLLETNDSIEKIAENCGFCDRSYFSTSFREHVGLAPALFRKQGRAGLIR